MKLPLIGLQTNPSGTASSPSTRPPPSPAQALSFLPWASTVDNLVSKRSLLRAYSVQHHHHMRARPRCPDPELRALGILPAPAPALAQHLIHAHSALQGLCVLLLPCESPCKDVSECYEELSAPGAARGLRALGLHDRDTEVRNGAMKTGGYWAPNTIVRGSALRTR